MLRIALMLVVVFAFGILATTKTVAKRVAKPDSTVKIDTTMVITNDSMQIIDTYRDTLILIKSDTTRIPGKIKRVVPIIKAPVIVPVPAAPVKK